MLPTDDYTIQQEFIDLIDGVLHSQFENKYLSQFWISLADMSPHLDEMVLRAIMPFLHLFVLRLNCEIDYLWNMIWVCHDSDYNKDK